jgi:transcription-repair coupling factor (superfamily II helicase)
MPKDPLVIRESIMREFNRGGQVFYVTPRLEDLPSLKKELQTLVPEVKFAVAHGQLSPTELEDVMTAFYDHQFDVLISTNIIESGIDVPSANTLIIHRCDLFGLSQLYQLRGRVGRSKTQGYAYLTYSAKQTLSANAMKRLQVLQSLDTLGAGFTLASHDLDIRGAGNIVGEEQSGHIREVGVELYQTLLHEAIMMARAVEANNNDGIEIELNDWTPQINLGVPVLIPESYVTDLRLRLNLYRRVANLTTRAEIDAFAAELIDRFGKLPVEAANLLDVVELKGLCRKAHIEKLQLFKIDRITC